MDTNRKTAITVGVLFIMGTVSGVLSVIFAGGMLAAPDYLAQIAANSTQFMIGALCVLVMGFSLAMIPVVAYPVLRKYNQPLALGYVVFRGALETFTYFMTVISWLLLVVLSQQFVKTGAPDVSYFQALGTLLLESGDQINHVLKIVFPLGALMFNYVLYQSKLVPRWLSVWGMIGVALHLAEGLLTLFGLVPADVETIVAMPIALQEMVFAVWLIVKGFNPAVVQDE